MSLVSNAKRLIMWTVLLSIGNERKGGKDVVNEINWRFRTSQRISHNAIFNSVL